MLITDRKRIGSKLLAIRKRAGLTQSEVAELSELSDRTYADIERGSVNMRMETVLSICKALHITPDVILTEKNSNISIEEDEIIKKLKSSSEYVKETGLRILAVYLDSTIQGQ